MAESVHRPAHAQAGAAGIVALIAALQEVRQSIADALNTADVAAKNRLEQARMAVEAVLTRLDQLRSDAVADVERLRIEAIGNAFEVLSQAGKTMQDLSREGLIGVNSALVNAGRVISSLPLTKPLNPFVFAVVPLRIRVGATDRQISVHGWFPNANGAYPVVVRLRNRQIMARESVANTVVFDVTSADLEPAHFLPFTIIAPGRRRFIGRDDPPTEIEARIYVEAPKPFRIAMTFFRPAPEQWAEVQASTPATYTANSDQTSVNQSVSAADLFSITVNDNVNYDAATARLVKVPDPVPTSGKPCECCPEPTGRMTGWNEQQISFELRAPNCPHKRCSRSGVLEVDYLCGGGGSHYDLSFQPTFRVRLRSQLPDQVVQSTERIAGREEVLAVGVPEYWATARIDVAFEDGDEKRQALESIRREVGKVTSPIFDAEIQGSRLVLKMR